MTHQSYAGSREVHGVAVGVFSDSAELGVLADRRLAAFPATERSPEIRIEITTFGPLLRSVPESYRIVHESLSGKVGYDDARHELVVVYGGHGSARCDVDASAATIAVEADYPASAWVATRPLLTLCLFELLKHRGLFALHAGAAARSGEAVVLSGQSGAGKSTTTLSLLLAGWSFLGDDALFLRDGMVLGFPDEIDASPATFDLLPSLGRSQDWPTLVGYPKHQLGPEALRPGSTTMLAAPSAVVLPTVGEAHALEEVGADEVLLELVPNVLLTDVAVAQLQLDALADLVARCRRFRLTLGPDIASIPDVLRRALD